MKNIAYYTLSFAFMIPAMTLGGCDESTAKDPNADAGTDGGVVDFSSGTELSVPVAADARTYVRLEEPALVDAETGTSKDWDLAFVGYNVYTNSGPSGPGQAAAFGPLDTVTFMLDEAPQAPFMAQDKTGGAFLGWYFYDGGTHYLYSRFHTFGVRDGEKLWKVQLLTFYGERNGGPVSALYKLRYAQLSPTPGPTQTITLDGVAGGSSAPPNEPSGCIDLETGVQVLHTPVEASTVNDWHICARRDVVSVNGGVSGPRGATSADLDAAKSTSETLGELKGLTEQSTQAAFEAVTAESFRNVQFLVDGPVSAFRDLWIDKTSAPPIAGYGAWVVKSAKSEQLYLIAFPEFVDSTATSPTQVQLFVKKISGSTK